jgi:hypothetical protein
MLAEFAVQFEIDPLWAAILDEGPGSAHSPMRELDFNRFE